MLEHVVLFKVKPDTPPEQVDAMAAAIRGLKGAVPGIVDLSFGPNLSERAQGFTHGLVVRFADRAGLQGYLPHPVHREVVENRIRPIVEDVLAVDYEFQALE